MKTNGKGKEATAVMSALLSKFYEKMLSGLSPEERSALSDRVKAEADFPAELGAEVNNGMFVFNCPETGALLSASGFHAHGNINPVTSEIEAVITITCKSCKKEHAVAVVSFQNMLKMPELIEPTNTP